MQKLDDNRQSHGGNKVVLGVVLLILGSLLLLDNFDIIFFPVRIFSWQVILIIIGVILIIQRNKNVTGYILIGIGLFFILPDFFNLPHFNRHLFWPAIFITIGLLIIFRHRDKVSGYDGPGRSFETESGEYIDDMAIFGGGDKIIHTSSFKGGRITNIFGGSNINLLESKLAEGRHIIDVFCLFGGSKFLIPSDWNIKIETTSIFGGFSDRRKYLNSNSPDQNRVLVFKGVVLFGGGEIKNF